MVDKYPAVRVALEELMENASKVYGQNIRC